MNKTLQNKDRKGRWENWLNSKELSCWNWDRELFCNNFVLKEKVRSNCSYKIYLTTKFKWKTWIFQGFKLYLKNGWLAIKFTCLHNFFKDIRNSLKTYKVQFWHLLNFLFKLWKFLDFQNTTWKNKVIGRIGWKR